MQYIFLDAILSFMYLISIDNRDIIDKTIFEIMRIMKFFWKLNIFSTTSYPVRMTSSGADFYGMKGLGLNFKEKKTVIESDVPGGPHIF